LLGDREKRFGGPVNKRREKRKGALAEEKAMNLKCRKRNEGWVKRIVQDVIS